MDQKKSVLDGMSPMQIFAFGIVEGFLVLCTIGFFFLLAGGSSFDMMGGSAKKVAVAPQPAAAGEPAANIDLSVDVDEEHVRGDKKAEFTVVEYSDFECPFCSRFHSTMQQVMADMGAEVNWVYRHFPLESIHPNARGAANASECAAEQGKFWEYADLLIANQSSLGVSSLKNYAVQLGLNAGQFNNCLDSNKYDAQVQEDIESALATGGRGTPHSIVINSDGETAVISGAQPIAGVKAAIDSLR